MLLTRLLIPYDIEPRCLCDRGPKAIIFWIFSEPIRPLGRFVGLFPGELPDKPLQREPHREDTITSGLVALAEAAAVIASPDDGDPSGRADQTP